MKEKGDFYAKQKKTRRRSSKEEAIVESKKRKRDKREIGGTRCASEREDEEDERSATRIGQDRRTGDYRGRRFPGDEHQSPAGFHLIPSWLTTDSLSASPSTLSIYPVYIYSLSFSASNRSPPLTSFSLFLLFASLKHSVLLPPSVFDQPTQPSPSFVRARVSPSLSRSFSFLFISLAAFLFRLLSVYSAFTIRLFLQFTAFRVIFFSPSSLLPPFSVFHSLWQLYFGYTYRTAPVLHVCFRPAQSNAFEPAVSTVLCLRSWLFVVCGQIDV